MRKLLDPLKIFLRFNAVTVTFSLLFDFTKAILFNASCVNTAPPFRRAFNDIPWGSPATLNGFKTSPIIEVSFRSLVSAKLNLRASP